MHTGRWPAAPDASLSSRPPSDAAGVPSAAPRLSSRPFDFWRLAVEACAPAKASVLSCSLC